VQSPNVWPGDCGLTYRSGTVSVILLLSTSFGPSVILLGSASDEVTHLLHICKELTPPGEISADSSEPSSSSAAEGTASNDNDNENEKDTDETS
jgi:hypothetical protein